MSRMKIERVSVEPDKINDERGLAASHSLHVKGFRLTANEAPKQKFNERTHSQLFKSAYPCAGTDFFIEFPNGIPEPGHHEPTMFMMYKGGNFHGGGERIDAGSIFADQEHGTDEQPIYRATGDNLEYCFHLAASPEQAAEEAPEHQAIAD